MKKIIFLLLGAALFIGSCSKDPTTMPTGSSSSDLRIGHEATAANLPPTYFNTTQVYFNDALITVQLTQLVPQDAAAVMPHLTPMNVLYRFVSFENGVEHSTMNFVVGSMSATKYWREVKVVFNSNAAPFQMTSAFEVQSFSNVVTLIPTNTVYRYDTAPDISL